MSLLPEKIPPHLLEAACRGVYGKGWDGPIEKMPGEAMKEVWRDMIRRAWAEMVKEERIEGSFKAANDLMDKAIAENNGDAVKRV